MGTGSGWGLTSGAHALATTPHPISGLRLLGILAEVRQRSSPPIWGPMVPRSPGTQLEGPSLGVGWVVRWFADRAREGKLRGFTGIFCSSKI